jgi:hypothetical protein
LSDEDLVELVKRLLDAQMTSERRLMEACQILESQEVDPVQTAHQMSEIQADETQVTRVIIRILGAIFLIYQQRTLNLLAMLFSVHVSPFARKKDPRQAHFVFGLIEVATKHLGAFLAAESLSLCLALALEYADGPNWELKILSLASIGHILTVSRSLNLESCEQTIKVLSLIINFGASGPNPSVEVDPHEANDAAVAAFGRLLRHQRHLLAKDRLRLYLIFWMRNLPVRSPPAETKVQSELFLAEMLQVEDTVGLDNPDTLGEAVRVLTSIKNGPHSDAEAREKAGMLLRKISERKNNRV